MIIKKYNLFIEALKPSVFRKYVKEFNKERYADIFKEFGDKYQHDKNYYRIYLPLSKGENITETEITKYLNDNNYDVIDYTIGSCKFRDAKNPSRIGQVLTRLKQDDLMKKFVEDPIRKSGSDLLVCISRHPYDIAGADTDRAWTNCMTIGNESSKKLDNLMIELDKLSTDKKTNKLKIDEVEGNIEEIKQDGTNVKYLINDVKEGSLIAYLIKSTDKNIQNPISNLNIKPYVNVNNENDILLELDNKMYGNGSEEFRKTVSDWLKSVNKQTEGLFCLNKNLYKDNPDKTYISLGDDLSNIKNQLNTNNLTLDNIFYIFDYFNNLDNDCVLSIEKSIDVNKFLSLIQKMDFYELFSKLSDEEVIDYEWIIIPIIVLSGKYEKYSLLDSLLSNFETDVYDSESGNSILDLADIGYKKGDKHLINILNSHFDLIEIYIENNSTKDLIKLLKTLNLKFKVSEKSNKYTLTIDSNKYKFDNDSMFDRLVRLENINNK